MLHENRRLRRLKGSTLGLSVRCWYSQGAPRGHLSRRCADLEVPTKPPLNCVRELTRGQYQIAAEAQHHQRAPQTA